MVPVCLQDLMQLFIEHQIPSDLLSFSADEAATGTDKLAEVKSHVVAMKTMIEEEKDRELKESARQAEYEEKAARQRAAQQADLKERTARRSAPLRVHDEMMMAPEMMMAGAAPVQYEAQFATASMKSATPQTNRARKDTTDRRRANSKKGATAHETVKETSPGGGGGGGMKGSAVDYTRIAAEMDHQFEQLDPEGVLRPTVISTASPWVKKSSKGLLGKLESKRVTSSLQKDEKASAFGLLDALTRGGGLSVEHAELHIMVAATHQFDKSLTEMVVKDNVNPIERVERSTAYLDIANPFALYLIAATSPAPLSTGIALIVIRLEIYVVDLLLQVGTHLSIYCASFALWPIGQHG